MEKYMPDIYQKSIYTIDYSKLLSRGIKCILFDLDNTLVPAKTEDLTEKTKELIISLKQKGFKIIIFSNSPKRRVKYFADILNVDFISFACKPFTGKLKKFIHNSGYKLNELANVGDQMYTDVLCGNKVGITSILVNPCSNKNYFVGKIFHFLEIKRMKKLRDKNLFCKGRYYD